MAYNVFVSYKYADTAVRQIVGHNPTKVRHYVDEIENLLAADDHVYFGEHDGEDLSDWTDEQIWGELKDRIYPTTCTIVLISPNMKEPNRYDKSQWIPWEISYSLRETTRGDRTSKRNAVLAVVLPYENGSYDYAITENNCYGCLSKCTSYNGEWMFTILKENMFNRKNPVTKKCEKNSTIWYGEYNYIPFVTWDYFKNNVSNCIDRVEKIKDDVDNYELHLSVNQ